MNGIFPRNTSASTVERIINAAVKGENVKDASLGYKTIFTEVGEYFNRAAGFYDYYEELDPCKIELSEALDGAMATLTDSEYSISSEFSLNDEQGIKRYYRLVRFKSEPDWFNSQVFGGSLFRDIISMYQYDAPISDKDIRHNIHDCSTGSKDNIKLIYTYKGK
ncbi:MAG: hypothetical protein K0R08_734 [Solimicrobium sp.]|jgi:hypothetical protein|nr:hypothetical protein [Solimicrobium sp.]